MIRTLIILVVSLICNTSISAQELSIPVKEKKYYDTIEIPNYGFAVFYEEKGEVMMDIYNKALRHITKTELGESGGSLSASRIFANESSFLIMQPNVILSGDGPVYHKRYVTRYLTFDFKGNQLGKLEYNFRFENVIPHGDAFFAFVPSKKKRARLIKFNNKLEEIWVQDLGKYSDTFIRDGARDRHRRSTADNFVSDEAIIFHREDRPERKYYIDAYSNKTGKLLYSTMLDESRGGHCVYEIDGKELKMLSKHWTREETKLYYTIIDERGKVIKDEKINLEGDFKNFMDVNNLYAVLKIIDENDIGYRFIAEAMTGDAFEIYQFGENFQPHSTKKVTKKLTPDKKMVTSKDAKYSKLTRAGANFNVLKMAVPSTQGDFDWLVYVYRYDKGRKLSIEAVASDGSETKPFIQDIVGLENIKFVYGSTDLELNKKYNSCATSRYSFIQGENGKAIFAIHNPQKSVLEFYELDFDKK